jgi:hypothetical protein
MPKLLQRLGDGGYYFRTHLYGTRQIITYQLRPAGVRFLQEHHIQVDEEFTEDLVRELREKSLIYTGGSGIDLDPPELRLAKTAPSVAISSSLDLMFIENEIGWELAILFPELPAEWLHRADDPLGVLTGCHFQINRIAKLPATRLWPGKGGAHVSIRPQPNSYTIQAEGTWPTEWQIGRWVAPLVGLAERGTFFDSEHRTRMRAGKTLDAGSSYCVVIPEELTRAYGGAIPFPPELARREIGKYSGWRAWEVELPADADDAIKEWCRRIGHPLAEPCWTTTLVSPAPHRYTPDDLPVIHSGQNIVIGLVPPHQFESHPDVSTEYRVWWVGGPGTYEITSPSQKASALTIVVEHVVPVATQETLMWPAPLSLKVVDAEGAVELQAFREGGNVIDVELALFTHQMLPQVTATCHTTVDVTWLQADSRQHREQIDTEDIPSLIAEALHSELARERQFEFGIAAGSFGALTLRLLVPSEKTHVAFTASTIRRARWLAAVLPALTQHGSPVVPLPRELRTTLEQIAILPGCATLRNVQIVPRSLLPHLRSLGPIKKD